MERRDEEEGMSLSCGNEKETSDGRTKEENEDKR